MTNLARQLRLSDVALFLDIDGTLAPFAPVPEGVKPDLARNGLLRDLLMALDGRLAVVSGRAIADIDRILEGTVLSVAGSHGLQRRDARLEMHASAPHPKLQQAISEVTLFSDAHAGTRLELKPLSVALHYRGNPDIEPEVRVFARDLAQRTGLKLQTGAFVAEFLSPGMDKGRAIAAFMAESPFSDAIPVFVGDDVTDEDGFRAVKDLGGFGILVGPPRDTYAAFRLDSVEGVHAWLAKALKDAYFNLEVPVEPSHSRI
ncbi:MAG: trehalose-phosphatase [Asticcacaulis sp.]